MFYTVAISAPGYWTDAEDYAANMDSSIRHDISRCHMMMDDVIPVGFVNQCFLYCADDEAMTKTVQSAVNNPNEILQDEETPEAPATNETADTETDTETAGNSGTEN